MAQVPKGYKTREELDAAASQAQDSKGVKEQFKELGDAVDTHTKSILKDLKGFAQEYQEDGKIVDINKDLSTNGRRLKKLAELAGLESKEPVKAAESFEAGKIDVSKMNKEALEVFQRELQAEAKADPINARIPEFADLRTAEARFKEVEEALQKREQALRVAVSKLTDVTAALLPRMRKDANEVAKKLAVLAARELPGAPDFEFDYADYLRRKKGIASLEKEVAALTESVDGDKEAGQRASSEEALEGENPIRIEKAQEFAKKKEEILAFCRSLFDLQRIKKHGRKVLALVGDIKNECEANIEDGKGSAAVRAVIQDRLRYADGLLKVLNTIVRTGSPTDAEIAVRFRKDPTLKREEIGLDYGWLSVRKLSDDKQGEDIKKIRDALEFLVTELDNESELTLHAENALEQKPVHELSAASPASDAKKLQTKQTQLEGDREYLTHADALLKGEGREAYAELQALLQQGRKDMTSLAGQVMIEKEGRDMIDPEVREFLTPELVMAIIAAVQNPDGDVYERYDVDFFQNAHDGVSDRTNVQGARDQIRDQREDAQLGLSAALDAYFKRWTMEKGKEVAKAWSVKKTESEELDKDMVTKREKIYGELDELRKVIARITGAIEDQLRKVPEIRRAVTGLQTSIDHAGQAMKALGMKPADLVTDENARTLAGALLICRDLGQGGVTQGAELLLPLAADEKLAEKVAKPTKPDVSTALVAANLSGGTSFAVALPADNEKLKKLGEAGRQNYLVHQQALAGQVESVVQAVHDNLFVRGPAVREVAGEQTGKLGNDLLEVFNVANGAVKRYEELARRVTEDEKAQDKANDALRKARNYKTSTSYADERMAIVSRPDEDNPYGTAVKTLEEVTEAKEVNEAKLMTLQAKGIPAAQKAVEAKPLEQAIQRAESRIAELENLRDTHYDLALEAADRTLLPKYDRIIHEAEQTRDAVTGNLDLLRAQRDAYGRLLTSLATVCARFGGLYARMSTVRKVANSMTGMHAEDMGDLAEFFSGLSKKFAQINKFVVTENDRNIYNTDEAVAFLKENIIPIVEGETSLEEGEFGPQADISYQRRSPDALQQQVRKAAVDIVAKGRNELDEDVIDAEFIVKAETAASVESSAASAAFNSASAAASPAATPEAAPEPAPKPVSRRKRVDD